MHLRDHPSAAAGILLACIAAHYAAFDHARVWPRAAPLLAPVHDTLPPAGAAARRTFEWCRENVATIHDMYWAGTCSVVAAEQRRRRLACGAGEASTADPLCAPNAPAPDDSPDCTLPDERALALNAGREKAEQKCLDDALATASQAH